MADTKISAMPPVANLTSTDLFPVVQTLANMTCKRGDILHGQAFVDIVLSAGNGAFVQVSNVAGGGLLSLEPGGNAQLITNGTLHIQGGGGTPALLDLDSLGNVHMDAVAGGSILLGTALGTIIKIDKSTNVITINSVVQPFVSYVPTVPGNWALPVPTDLATAINRLVAAVIARTIGGPV